MAAMRVFEIGYGVPAPASVRTWSQLAFFTRRSSDSTVAWAACRCWRKTARLPSISAMSALRATRRKRTQIGTGLGSTSLGGFEFPFETSLLQFRENLTLLNGIAQMNRKAAHQARDRGTHFGEFLRLHFAVGRKVVGDFLPRRFAERHRRRFGLDLVDHQEPAIARTSRIGRMIFFNAPPSLVASEKLYTDRRCAMVEQHLPLG